MKKRIAYGVLLVCCALVFSACGLFPEEEERKRTPILKEAAPLPFQWATVTKGDLQLTKKITAYFVPVQKAVLNFSMEGEPIDDMFVSVGDTVKKGQVLGQLELGATEDKIAECLRQTERIELQIAQLEENRELAVRRQAVLYADDGMKLAAAVSDVNAQYDASLTSLTDSLSVQKLNLTTLQADMERHRIISTIDGVVSYVNQYDENARSVQMDVAVIVSDTSLSVFSANTEYWEMLPEGIHVPVSVGGTMHDTVVTKPEDLGMPKVERTPGEKGMVYLALSVADAGIKDNAMASFDILLDERKDVLLISADAVSRAGEDYIVYYQNDDGVRAYKTVELGLQANGQCEVLSGLEEGEEVILP